MSGFDEIKELLHQSITLIFAFISQFEAYCVVYCRVYCAIVKQHIITTAIIFSFHNNSFLINDATLFKAVTFIVEIFDVALFDLLLNSWC